MQRLVVLFLFAMLLLGRVTPVLAGEGGIRSPLPAQGRMTTPLHLSGRAQFEFAMAGENLADTTVAAAVPEKNLGMTPRRVNAIVLSAAIPGAGQTMLGDTYKGLGFTLAYFGSALTAVISHNNFVARGERLDALEYQYANSTSWSSSNIIYGQMKESFDQWRQDRQRRNIFIAVTAVIWIANIADVIYNTEDSGARVFSGFSPGAAGPGTGSLPPPIAQTPLFTFSIPLKK